jgi:hypothetical protein
MASKAERVQGWGAPTSKAELLQSYAGLGSLASKAEIVQGCGARPRETELLQGCAGLGGRVGLGLAEIVNVCGSLALRASPREILWV